MSDLTGAPRFAGSVRVERMVPGGAGLGRTETGEVRLVVGAAPGDRLLPRAQSPGDGALVVRAFELLEHGPDRVRPECPWADRCGGCDWMHLERGAELREKRGLVRDALARVGRLSEPRVAEVVTAGESAAVRDRARLHVSPDGRVGFLAARSREVVEVDRCRVVREEVNSALATLRAAGARYPGALLGVAELELRVAPLGRPVGLSVRPRESAPGQTMALLRELAGRWSVAVGTRGRGSGPRRAPGSLPPAEDQRWPLPAGATLRAPPDAFTQPSQAVGALLVAEVVRGAAERDARTFVDLFCGAGAFALALGSAGARGIGVELDGPAVRAAERQGAEDGLTAVRFVRGDAARLAGEVWERGGRPDLAVVDPPRGGARSALDGLLRLRPPAVAMCSCDPATLARDLRMLVDGGYAVEAVVPYDMFPRTHHVETIVWLAARASR